MTHTDKTRWERMRTDETRSVEKTLRDAGFGQVDAYRYNSASIRIRVVDAKFEGLSPEKRDEMVEPHLEHLPESTQADILNLFTFAPSELKQSPETFREYIKTIEFDDPSPSML